MEGKKSIVVLGSLNMDLVMMTPRMPAAGETMHGTSFDTHPGGKGLNQAIAAQRLLHNTGWKTYMIGRVGEDDFADRLKASLDKEGVDVSQVKPATGKTSGVALIIVRIIQVNSTEIVGGRKVWTKPNNTIRSRRKFIFQSHRHRRHIPHNPIRRSPNLSTRNPPRNSRTRPLNSPLLLHPHNIQSRPRNPPTPSLSLPKSRLSHPQRI